MTDHSNMKSTLPSDKKMYYETVASQEEVYLERIEEELRMILIAEVVGCTHLITLTCASCNSMCSCSNLCSCSSVEASPQKPCPGIMPRIPYGPALRECVFGHRLARIDVAGEHQFSGSSYLTQ